MKTEKKHGITTSKWKKLSENWMNNFKGIKKSLFNAKIPDLQKIIIEWQYNFCRTQLFVGLRIALDVPEHLAAQRA